MSIKNQKFDFSFVIPTCNRNDLLEICLDKLSKLIFDREKINIEVIISDDSTSLGALEFITLQFPMYKWVQGPQKGPAANRNNGVRYAKGDWIIFLDDDCIPDINILNAYYLAITTFSNNNYVFEGKISSDRVQLRFDEEAPLNLTGNRLWSCNFCINKNFFIEIGGFDERFPFASMEDIDLHERIKNYCKIYFVESAQVIHPWRKIQFGKNFRKRLFSFKIFVQKHYKEEMVAYRFSRFKIFLSSTIFNFQCLCKYRFRGFLYFFELTALNFCTIFIK